MSEDLTIMTATDPIAGNGRVAPVPQQETLTRTKRERLFHCVKLNSSRFDWVLRPMMQEIDDLPVAERAAFRVLLSLANKALHIDFTERPHAIFLLLIHLIPDNTFVQVWNDLKPLLEWVAKGEDE